MGRRCGSGLRLGDRLLNVAERGFDRIQARVDAVPTLVDGLGVFANLSQSAKRNHPWADKDEGNNRKNYDERRFHGLLPRILVPDAAEAITQFGGVTHGFNPQLLL